MKKYFIDENGEHRFANLDGSEDQYIQDDWEYIGEDTEDKPFEFPQTLAEAKSKKLSIFSTQYESAVKAMIGDTDTSEMASWTKQESEARAWIADNTALTPVIDNLLIGRNMGETKAQLVAKIIAKADGYAVAYSQVLGQYHAKQKSIEACATVEEVNAL